MSFVIRLLLVVSLFFSISNTIAQQTGYSDLFQGALKVSGPPSFRFEQADGQLLIKIDKESKTWQGIYYNIGETIDISSAPFMNIKLKSSTPFLLTAYIVDAQDNNMTQNIKIYQSDTFISYCIDFSSFASHGVDASRVTALIFTPNGNTHDGLVADVFLDELHLGTNAAKCASVGAVPSLLCFVGSQGNSIKILDLKNAKNLIVSGAESSLANVTITDILNSMATITFDCQEKKTGQDTIKLTVVGDNGYLDNSIAIPVFIEDNNPPTMDNIADQEAMVGDTLSLVLTGIDDGNNSIDQSIKITPMSSNQQALPDSNLILSYTPGQSVARLSCIPVESSSDISITLQMDDQYANNNLFTRSFMVNAFQDYNHAPTIDPVPDQFTYQSFGQRSIALTGITDGDDGSQNLFFSTTSINEMVIPNENISIFYTPGQSLANLLYTPLTTGKTTITLILQDDGGTAANNGDGENSVQFQIEVGELPPTGHTVPLADFFPDTSRENVGDWNVEGLGVAQKPVLGSFLGKDDVLKIELEGKSCWTGIWYRCPEINVDEFRYLCYEIYFEGGSFATSGNGLTHCYYWDDGDDAGIDRNLPAAHAQRKTVKVGQWSTVFMDFRGADGMLNDDGEEINVKRIQKILINYATSFGWPFPVDDGTVYLANIRLGSNVPNDLVPALTPQCTIDPLPNITLFPGSGERSIPLSGITDGAFGVNAPKISATSSNRDFIPNPVMSAVATDGTATLTFKMSENTGSTTISVTVSAQDSRDKSISFKIEIIDNNVSQAAVELNRDSLYQTIRGFGTFHFPDQQNYIDYYKDLGASAVRIGIIGNQIEPINDNNDPNVVDMTAFNYNAFDFDYYKLLRANGVETFILTSWSPPAWMKRNMSTSYGYASAPNYEDTDNILESYYYDEFAESLTAAYKMFQDQAGICLDAIGPQNEPTFTEPYPSAVLSPSEYAKLVSIIGQKFKQEGISTKFFLPEQVFSQNHYSMSQYISAVKANPLADEYTHVIATHGYDTDGVGEGQPTFDGWTRMWKESQKCQFPKEFWMTETYPEYSNWNSALSLAGAIHGALAYGNVGLWTLWSIEGTLMERGRPTESFYTSKNYYKYIRPGARRIKAESNHNDILVSSFIHPEKRTLTTVLINKGDKPLTVTMSGDSIPAFYNIYLTAQYIHCEYQGQATALQSIAIPAKSVMSLVGNLDGPIADVTDNNNVPIQFQLCQNYPNPFNPTTTIQFLIPINCSISLKIYNVLGQQVRTLVDRNLSAGVHAILWDGKSDSGCPVSSGMYFYKMKAQDFISIKKCLLVR